MKPVKQTITDAMYGNCLQACIASVLELKLDLVPNFMLFEEHWWSALIMWLGTNSYSVEYIESFPPRDDNYYVGSLKYKCHAAGISHAVVMQDGKIVHNPWVNNKYDNITYEIHGYYKLIKKSK